jgi:hypothetical protein
MSLVLVHGINQEGKSEAIIRRDWIGALEAALGRPGRFAEIQVEAPFYGDILAQLTTGGTTVRYTELSPERFKSFWED